MTVTQEVRIRSILRMREGGVSPEHRWVIDLMYASTRGEIKHSLQGFREAPKRLEGGEIDGLILPAWLRNYESTKGRRSVEKRPIRRLQGAFKGTFGVRKWKGVQKGEKSHRKHYNWKANRMSRTQLIEAILKLQDGQSSLHRMIAFDPKWDAIRLEEYKAVAGIKGRLSLR